MTIRLRYMATWLFLQTGILLGALAVVLGLPAVWMSLFGFSLGLMQAILTYAVWSFGRAHLELRG